MKSVLVMLLTLGALEATAACVAGSRYRNLSDFDYKAKGELYHGLGVCRAGVAKGNLPRNRKIHVEYVDYSEEHTYVIRAWTEPRGSRSKTWYHCKGIINWVRNGSAVTQKGYLLPWCGLW